MLARFILWRLIEFAAVALVVSAIAWVLDGGPRALLASRAPATPAGVLRGFVARAGSALLGGMPVALTAMTSALLLCALVVLVRLAARRRRVYLRWRVAPYRTDQASVEGIVGMFESLHKLLLRRWWQRALLGQPSLSLEVHRSVALTEAAGGCEGSPAGELWLAVSCPAGAEPMVGSALRGAYPNSSLVPTRIQLGAPPSLMRLQKRGEFIKRAVALDRYELESDPPINRLMRIMGSCVGPAYVQIAITPAPAVCERYATAAFKHHERRVGRRGNPLSSVAERSLYDTAELKGALDLQHRSLFFADLRVVASDGAEACRISAELRSQRAENSLVERDVALSQRLRGAYGRRLTRGEGNPLPSPSAGIFASTELAGLWHLPSVDFQGVPFGRHSVPVAPAPPGIHRPRHGQGLLLDELGPVSIHPGLRRQNTAVPGAVDQGKSSYIVASVAEDLCRSRCAVILLDPKGDAADAALSAVPAERDCTLLDFAHPTCGFNPLAVHAPADVVADYVVASLRNLFTDADIRASSDRYLRNAIIAVLAHDEQATLWDAARLLSVGQEGYAYRARVGTNVRAVPALKEISEFFTAELAAQLVDARSMTTAKLDAPVNKLARLLNSPSIKRILLNRSLLVDFDRIISGCEVLIVKGALGAMGAGNTSVLMQMLMGMLDAALARQQDHVERDDRVAVALKIDEAPLVVNRGFAETLALKRSAGLETVACWQTDAQWVDREIRDQLDALFAHRVYFATASTADARAAAALMMAEFSDSVRPGMPSLSTLGHPDARLHLPKHHAIVSFTTPAGRQSPFVARTIPLRIDRARMALHKDRQAWRGGRFLEDLSQPHWDRPAGGAGGADHVADSRPARPPPGRPGSQDRIDNRPRANDAAPGADRQSRRGAGAAGAAGEGSTAVARSYGELVDLDGAHRLRTVAPGTGRRSVTPERLDIEIIELVAQFRFVLSSQLHNRYNEARSATTTQRRLKRLSDAGLLSRLQFHRRDGAGIPMCYAVTDAGLSLLRESGSFWAPGTAQARGLPSPARAPGGGGQGTLGVGRESPTDMNAGVVLRQPWAGERVVAQVRHDVHVVGWVLGLERALGAGRARLVGPKASVLEPPSRDSGRGERTVCLGDLRLPGGRTAHDFWRTTPDGQRVEVMHFDTVRPDATVTLPAGSLGRPGIGAAELEPGASGAGGAGPAAGRPVPQPGDAMAGAVPQGIDLLIELDDRIPAGRAAAKLERYDHLLSGWVMHTQQYRARLGRSPIAVFVCRDRARARECARRADAVLVACQAYAGEHPWHWRYPGRRRILFCAERDVHEGDLRAYGVPPLPPEVRASQAGGNPAVRAPEVVHRELPWAEPPDGTG